MNEDDVAYVCETCGEAFAPMDREDWITLRAVHKSEHALGLARFTKTTVGKAF